MRVLFEIVHPADVLFFFHPIRFLIERGADICIASREKDVTVNLLEEFQLEHKVLSVSRSGVGALALELIVRDIQLYKLVSEFRPDVMAGFGGVAISHIGRLRQIPSISFYDSEHASLQIMLARPFITEWHVPSCFQNRRPHPRNISFEGIKELSYFHPDRFFINREIALEQGLDPDGKNILIRIVEWKASHDIGKVSFLLGHTREIIQAFSSSARIHISSEIQLPPDLQKFQFRGNPRYFHHLLGCCDLVIGESATITAEAAVLGVPGIFSADFELSYLDVLKKYNLVFQENEKIIDLITLARNALKQPKEEWIARRDLFARNHVDVAKYVADQIARLAASRR